MYHRFSQLATLRRWAVSAALLGLAACGGSSTDEAAAPDCEMGARVNGTAWCGTASYTQSIGAPGLGRLATVIGTGTDQSAIIIELPDATPGTYPLDAGQAAYNDPAFRTFGSIAGSVTVTGLAANGVLSGTFRFDAVDLITNARVNITDGRFAAKR
ncbi:MAG: DUF6252 family protein [Bernardetiaceae bacterium]|jgi:hypothetical protein|nr:DUF6252 family protein [Bernardetiaceae bacterium]